ncbi:MAG: sigma-54-dependent Fis family transcriptional regulator [Acidimicrobiia bacterium]|nr:sigma-54-dependent Fis family transcriptional regulator [Acidimicrobiia bacterium]
MRSSDQFRILVVDDDPMIRTTLEGILKLQGWGTVCVENGEDGIRMARLQEFDVVLLDLFLPGMSGIEVLRQLQSEGPAPEVIVVTGDPSVDSAVEAMRLGAYDYVTKPIDAHRIKHLTEQAAKRSRLERENRLLRRVMDSQRVVGTVVAESEPMQELLETVDRVALTDAPVLITGETGTGKGLVAKKVHAASPRSKAGFVHLNCGGLQEQLVESELFGHEKGAFTGAVTATPGLFEAANGGTIFLDEVTELNMAVQSKLLQVLDTGEVRRVGGSTLRSVDARIVAATNQEIEDSVKSGEFREDLFFRLNVVRLQIPPLRKRRADVAGLVEFYLDRYGGAGRGISDEALETLVSYRWPGNVRELSNIMQRAMLLSPNPVLQLEDLPLPAPGTAAVPSRESPRETPESLKENEKRHVARVLEYTGGTRAQAARILEVDIKTLRKKIRDYGLGE